MFNSGQIVWRIALPLVVCSANFAVAINDLNHLFGVFVCSDVGRYDVSVALGEGISNRFGRRFLHWIEQIDTSTFHEEASEAHVKQFGDQFFFKPQA